MPWRINHDLRVQAIWDKVAIANKGKLQKRPGLGFTFLELANFPDNYLAGLESQLGSGVHILESFTEDDVSNPSGIVVANVQLNNNQILNLKASPVILISAPGANQALIILTVVAVLHFTTAYNDNSGSPNATFNALGSGLDSVNDFHDLLTNTGAHASPRASLGNLLGGRVDFFAGGNGYSNAPFQILNDGGVEFAGGNASNTLSLRIWYSIMPTVPFGS